jgi:hypothetical protein
MRLLELEPRFLKITAPDEWDTKDIGIAEADGIIFLCPVCFVTNNGNVGTHSIICWKPHVPLERSPGPGRWNFLGTGFEDITLQAGSSSIFLTTADCKAHFHITNGEIK